MSLCAAIFVVLSARSENDVTGTIGNSDSSGLLHLMVHRFGYADVNTARYQFKEHQFN